MVSEEVVVKAVETLKGFSPEVLREAINEIPGMGEVMDNNNNHNQYGRLATEAQLLRAHQ